MACDLCSNEEELSEYVVAPKEDTITICKYCASNIENPKNNENHWKCLNDSMWSTSPAVQVVVFRLLSSLGEQDKLDMMYLEDDVKTWAKKLTNTENEEPVRDANGTILTEGDSVSIIKDLPVKGAGFTAKQGTTVKNIRMVPDDVTHIEGRVNGTMIFIISAFLKKL